MVVLINKTFAIIWILSWRALVLDCCLSSLACLRSAMHHQVAFMNEPFVDSDHGIKWNADYQFGYAHFTGRRIPPPKMLASGPILSGFRPPKELPPPAWAWLDVNTIDRMDNPLWKWSEMLVGFPLPSVGIIHCTLIDGNELNGYPYTRNKEIKIGWPVRVEWRSLSIDVLCSWSFIGIAIYCKNYIIRITRTWRNKCINCGYDVGNCIACCSECGTPKRTLRGR